MRNDWRSAARTLLMTRARRDLHWFRPPPQIRAEVARQFHNRRHRFHPPLRFRLPHFQLPPRMRLVPVSRAALPITARRPYVWERSSIRRSFKERLIPNAALHEIPVMVSVMVLESFRRNDIEASLPLIGD
jgi:hypothetical protein